MNKYKYLAKKANEIRVETIKSIGKLGVGHIGGSLSIVDVLAALYFDIMNIDPENPTMQTRDRFVLSKGHGGPALYSALALRGFFDIKELETLNKPNTNLPSHPDKNKTVGIDMTTGSLAQGFSTAVGMALGGKMDNMNCYFYTIIGDGESQEGQIWEAALFASSRNLDNLIAFTDYNKLQLDDYIENINGLYPLDKKWEAFAWHVQVIDGHDISQICRAVEVAKKIKNKPSMIILNTIKGNGAYFCNNPVETHSMRITEEMWKKAVEEIEGGNE